MYLLFTTVFLIMRCDVTHEEKKWPLVRCYIKLPKCSTFLDHIWFHNRRQKSHFYISIEQKSAHCQPLPALPHLPVSPIQFKMPNKYTPTYKYRWEERSHVGLKLFLTFFLLVTTTHLLPGRKEWRTGWNTVQEMNCMCVLSFQMKDFVW